MPRPPTLNELRWDVREVQKKLKKLGVTPPPPSGVKTNPEIMKPGKFYVAANALAPSAAYLARLREVLAEKENQWTADAYALLWKVKGKWRLVEGARDEVLAAVPDTHFEAATRALLG